MNLFKKLFSFSNDNDCAIGLCSFNQKEEIFDKQETPKRISKDATLSQMLKKPI